MTESLGSPGVTLVVLRRLPTSTEVMLLPSRDGGAALPCAAPSGGKSQWSLAEGLLRESCVGGVRALYASPLTVHRDGHPHGVFVAFLDPEEPAATRGDWMDLREACRHTRPLWSRTLSDVRERFVARSPDEALRVR